MEILNNKRSFVLFIFFLFTMNMNAGQLENILGSRGNSIGISNMQYISTQVRGYTTFGGISIKSNLGGNIRPFTIEAPSFHSGCGGVDVNLGGLSFLSMEQLGEKLKTIMSSAPTFVFQMALSVLCKDCQSILNQIDSIAESINSLNFDACKAAVNYGKAAGDVINNYMSKNDNTYKGVQTNLSGSKYFQNFSKNVQDYARTVQTYLDGTMVTGNSKDREDAKAKKYGGIGSFIKYALEERDKTITSPGVYTDTFKRYFGTLFVNSSTMNTSNIESFIRGFIGDVYGYTSPKCDNISSAVRENVTLPTYILIMPSMSADEFINFIYGDETVEMTKMW